jgi:hypothetical protein
LPVERCPDPVRARDQRGRIAGSPWRLLDLDGRAVQSLHGVDNFADTQASSVAAIQRHRFAAALEIFERLGTLIQPDKVKEELAGL